MATVVVVTFVIKGDVLKQINPCHVWDGFRDTLAKFSISQQVLIYSNS
jgi:hypothetical protein